MGHNTKLENIINKKGKISFPILTVCLYVVVAPIFENATAVNSSIASYLLYICLASCAISCIMNRTIQLNKMHICLFIFGIILSISCLYSPTNVDYMSGILYRYWTSFILVFLISTVIKTNYDINVVLYAFILQGVFSALVIYNNYGIDNLLNYGQRLENTPFGNVNSIGIYCAVSIALAIYKLVTEKRHKVLMIAAIIVVTPLIMFTGSRKALLSVLVGIIAFIFSYTENRNIIKRLFWIIVAVVSLFIMIEYIPAFESIRDRFVEMLNIFTTGDNLNGGDINRMMYLEKGFESFLESPLIGNGFCYSQYLFQAYSHNNYIELLMNNGIIGFASFYSVYVLLISNVKHITYNRKIYSLVVTIISLNLFCDVGVVSYYNRITLLIIMWVYMFVMRNQESADSYERC